MMQLFSMADREKKGELDYHNFEKALDGIKDFLIHQVMNMLGVSVKDMAISFTLSIIILCLMLAFIFIGIAAFSPTTSFSSVTNTILPLGAGATVNKGTGGDKGKDDDDALDDI